MNERIFDMARQSDATSFKTHGPRAALQVVPQQALEALETFLSDWLLPHEAAKTSAAIKAALAQEPTKTVLSRGVNGVCSRSACECEREGLGDQCIWLRPTDAELHRRKAALERTIK